MVRGRPEHSRRVHQVAILLKIHIEPPMLAVSERRTDGKRRLIARALRTGAVGALIEFIVIPLV